jgi:hypothetical protein
MNKHEAAALNGGNGAAEREIAPEGLERYATTRILTEKPVAYLEILLGVPECCSTREAVDLYGKPVVDYYMLNPMVQWAYF